MHANCKQENTAVTKTKQEDWRLDLTGIDEADAAQINTMACYTDLKMGTLKHRGAHATRHYFKVCQRAARCQLT